MGHIYWIGFPGLGTAEGRYTKIRNGRGNNSEYVSDPSSLILGFALCWGLDQVCLRENSSMANNVSAFKHINRGM